MTYRISWASQAEVWRIKHPGLDDVMQGRHLRALVESWRRTHPTDTLVRFWPETGWTIMLPAQDASIEPEDTSLDADEIFGTPEEQDLLPW